MIQQGKSLLRFSPLWIVVVFAAACGSENASPGLSTNGDSESSTSVLKPDTVNDLSDESAAACPNNGSARFRCFAQVRLNKNLKPFKSSAQVTGLTPADIKAAYALPTATSKPTVAVIDAYDDKNAESDLAVYRKQFGLPACTTANGCFKKVNQEGNPSPLPKAAPKADDWTGETSLDLDAVSAACPNCKILLVEADDDQGMGLYIANNTAAALGATVISNSWGGGESSGDISDDATYFNHSGIATFVSAGDSGYAAQFPATSPSVFSVGGTLLKKSSSAARGWTETVWNELTKSEGATGSGCSKFQPKPSFQNSVTTGCTKRASNDIAAVADPVSGLAVYDTANGNGGWQQVGGTSLASPLVAAIFALTGKGDESPSYVYANTTHFYDVTSGNDGTCSPKELCTAGKGWDGPTGWGTPDGALLAK